MKYRFCPNCGHEDSLVLETVTKSECDNCHEQFWNNPRATVAIIFVKDSQLLFSKRKIEPNAGKYDFPGGFLEYGEDPYAACVREIQEETTVTIKPEDLHLLSAYTEEYLPEIAVTDLIFVIVQWEGQFVATDDSAALEWKPMSFIQEPDFVPFYDGLEAKLQTYLGNNL
jgi:NAD+ diphosphatase